MKTKILSLVLLAAAAFAACGADLTYTIDAQRRLQKNEGWGVSLCWWANMCGKWPDADIDRLVDWLASPEGLNYNIFRYNIGGGDDPQNRHCTPHHMGKGKGLRAEMEGFQDGPGEPYNWTRDAAQRKILLKIRQKRPDAIFEAFSNSAPWWMTISGCVGGHDDANKDNLDPKYYTAFCRYLVDVCKHYKTRYGITFKTLEPFNEPVTDYWPRNGSQEGCHVGVDAQIEIVKVLAPILKASGLKTVISASDETSTQQSVETLKGYEKAGVLDLVGQWNVHTYGADNATRDEVGTRARRAKKMLWMSEVGAGGKGLDGNLALCQKLFDDVRHIRPDAWLDWQFVEERGDQWCTVNARFDRPDSARRVKNYYVRQQVTRFIKKGYTFVETPDAHALAAVDPAGARLVLVLLNREQRAVRHDIALRHARLGPVSRLAVWRTSADESMRRVDDPLPATLRDGHVTVDLPPQSLTTLLLPLSR